MNTIEAKRIRIVDYLRLLGHEPVKVRGGQYWYLSPLRKEDTPSFKVNDRLNEWYDFGLSEGGSIIELAMLFLRTSSVSEVLRLIEVQTGAAPLLRTRPHNAMPDAIEEMMKGVEVDAVVCIQAPCDHIVMNTVSNLKKTLQVLESYEYIHCYLDNDLAGQKTVETIAGLYGIGRTVNEAVRYADYKDLNDCLRGRKR